MEFLRNIYREREDLFAKLIPNFTANFQAAIMKEIRTPINETAAPSMYLVGIKSNFLPIHVEAYIGSSITSTTKWALNQIS